METNINERQNASENIFQRNKYFIKGILISFLILALIIPTFFISNIIDERKARNEEVKQEIGLQWSKAQTICGPVMVIPFIEASKDDKGKEVLIKRTAYFMPEKLSIKTKLLPEIKSRSIFKVPVYNSVMDINGNFAPLDVQALNISPDKFLLNDAMLVIGISDLKGLQEQSNFQWDGSLYNVNIGQSQGVECDGDLTDMTRAMDAVDPSSNANNHQALIIKVPLEAGALSKAHLFNMKLNLRGSEKIFFTPVGTSTKVSVEANWPDRDFKGNYLPDTHTLTDTGFNAQWNVYRSMQAQQKNALLNLQRTTFGINLIQPLDNYAKATRTIKYAILVIMLTFVVYFFIEVFQKKNVHAVQYVLIGFALCLFYTLLISISEYLNFQQAYLIAAGATIGLVSLYTKSVFNSLKTASIFGSFLSVLYLFIFILIQLQDGALLAGSVGLFLILACIMYFSRKIEWQSK